MNRDQNKLKQKAKVGSIGFVRLGRKQQLNAEITLEIGLVAAGGFEAAPGHKEKDQRAMDFVARAEVNRRLLLGKTERARAINLHVDLELRSEFMADHQAAEPAVPSFVDKLIADFVVHTDGSKFLREFEGQQESFTSGRDPPADGVIRVVEEELRENRDLEAGFPCIVETPLDAGIRLPQAVFGRGLGILNAQPGILISELDAVADSKIDVNVGSVRDRLIAVQKRHVTKIDFPVEMAGSAGIVGVVGRPALSKCAGPGPKKEEGENQGPKYGYVAKVGERFARLRIVWRSRFHSIPQDRDHKHQNEQPHCMLAPILGHLDSLIPGRDVGRADREPSRPDIELALWSRA